MKTNKTLTTKMAKRVAEGYGLTSATEWRKEVLELFDGYKIIDYYFIGYIRTKRGLKRVEVLADISYNPNR